MNILRNFRSSLKASFERMDKHIEEVEKDIEAQMKNVEADIDAAFDAAEKEASSGTEKETVVVEERPDGTKVTTRTIVRRIVAKGP